MSQNSGTTALTRSQLDRFHRELKSALAARVPLELGYANGSSGGMASVTKLDWLRNRIEARLQDAHPVTGELNCGDDQIPLRYMAALHLFESTGDVSLSLEGLTTRVRSRQHLSRVLRSSLLYLSFVLFVIAVFLSFYSRFIAPSMQEFRADLVLQPAVDAPERTDLMQYAPVVVIGLEAIAILVLLLTMFGISTKLVSLLGGKRYSTDIAAAIALRAIRSMVGNGMNANKATMVGCQLVGYDRYLHSKIAATTSDRGLSKNSSCQLDILADHFQFCAIGRLAVARAVLPMVLTVMIGGTACLGYALAIFWPLITLLKDLSLPGA